MSRVYYQGVTGLDRCDVHGREHAAGRPCPRCELAVQRPGSLVLSDLYSWGIECTYSLAGDAERAEVEP